MLFAGASNCHLKCIIASSLIIGASYFYKISSKKGTEKETISFKKNTKTTVDLIKGTPGSAGWDIFPDEAEIIRAGERKLISTGISIENMPSDYYIRIAPRSSLAKIGIDIGAGVVDSDYRGIIKVLIINNSDEVFPINNQIRIAQLIPEYCGNLNMQCFNNNLTERSRLSKVINEERGEGGFGSTDN